MRIFVFLCCLTFFSCATYVDRENINTDLFELLVYDDYNLYKRVNQVDIKLDNELYVRSDFEIKLPKNIINFRLGTYNVFEYQSKQVVLISSEIDRKQIDKEWKLKDINSSDILNLLDDYWTSQNYNQDILSETIKDRVTKIYTNGKVNILLYNIKNENFDHYFSLIKSFKEISDK